MPDQPPLDAPGSGEVKNVYPVLRGYKPIRSLVEISLTALNTAARGFYSAHASDGGVLSFAGMSGTGTAARIYQYSITSFTNVSRLSGAYTALGDSSYWEFVQFGALLIATTIENAVQYFDLDTNQFRQSGGI